jgi:DNA polymerase-3 subunit alpha
VRTSRWSLRKNVGGEVRFGLQAIKGIAKDAIASIVEARQEGGAFGSLHEFCERIDHARVNQKALESLVRAGALDSLHGADARAAMLEALPDAYKAGRSLSADRSAGQNMLFGGGGDDAASGAAPAPRLPLPEVKPWDQLTRLAEEKEALGFFVSGHPLDELAGTIAEFCTTTTARLADLPEGAPIIFAGVVNRVRPVVTKTGNKMAMSTMTDKHGTVEAVVFSEAFAKYGAELQVDRIVAVVGSLEKGRGEPQIVVEQVIPVERLPSQLATRVDILFDESRDGDRDEIGHRMRFVSGHLKQASRSVQALSGRPVETAVHLRLKDGRTVVLAAPGIRVVPDDDLVRKIRDAGADGVRVKGGYVPPRKEDRRRRFARAAGGGGDED